MIHVHVTYTFRNNEERDSYFETISHLRIPEQTRLEKGNYMYTYYVPLEKDNTIFLLEQWEDQASLDAHFIQPHYILMNEIKKKYVTKVELTRYQIHYWG